MTKKQFNQQVLSYFGQKYKDSAEVCFREVRKNNGLILDGMTIHKRGCNLSPTIYLNGFYESFSCYSSMEDILEKIDETYQKHLVEENIDVSFFEDFERVKAGLCFKLISKERNEELLKELPYQTIEDLALICQYFLPDFHESRGSIVIHSSHLKNWGIEEEELFRQAERSAPCVLPLRVEKLFDYILKQNMLEEERAPFGEYGLLPGEYDLPVYLLTNQYCMFGASVMAYPSVFSNLSQQLSDNLCIIPSSIHELLVLPQSMMKEVPAMTSMIREVNESASMCKEEILSDHPYLYLKEENRLISLGL